MLAAVHRGDHLAARGGVLDPDDGPTRTAYGPSQSVYVGNDLDRLLVKADEALAYGRVVDAMVILQHSGAQKVGFITEPLDQRAKRTATPAGPG